MQQRISRWMGLGVSVVSLAVVNVSQASCGSSFCALETSLDSQGVLTEPGQFGLDLRYEFVKQDALRAGTKSISPAEDTGDATELKTFNRNLIATLTYTLTPQWGLAASLPFVSRAHSHIDNETAEYESWNFSGLSDARVFGRYHFDRPHDAPDNFGLQFGVKLPTGDYKGANADGVVAERSLQPGTGTTDVIVGGHYSYKPAFKALTYFATAQFQHALAKRDEYRAGDQLSLTGGVAYAYADNAALMFQLNGLNKSRDSGDNAEPDVSGGRYIFASPGMRYAAGKDVQVYGFAQVPIYRNVNGIQLTADWSLVAGLTLRI
jgi:hypothetical protein